MPLHRYSYACSDYFAAFPLGNFFPGIPPAPLEVTCYRRGSVSRFVLTHSEIGVSFYDLFF